MRRRLANVGGAVAARGCGQQWRSNACLAFLELGEAVAESLDLRIHGAQGGGMDANALLDRRCPLMKFGE